MNTYKMTCSNGWTTEIKAKTLAGAKRKATNEATHGCGSFSLETPEGEVYSRSIWQGFNAWGWHKWEKIHQAI